MSSAESPPPAPRLPGGAAARRPARRAVWAAAARRRARAAPRAPRQAERRRKGEGRAIVCDRCGFGRRRSDAARHFAAREGRVILGYIRRRTKPAARFPAAAAVHSRALARCRNCPKSKPRAAASRPLVVGRRVAAMHVYDRRLRWSVPRWLPARIAGRTIDALDRRSKYLLFRLADRHAARPLRDDRQPAGLPRRRRRAGRTTTSTSCSIPA